MSTAWKISDIMDIVREGAPFADLSSISINTNYQHDPNLVITFGLAIPVDKCGDLSIPATELNSFWLKLLHPALHKDGNWVEVKQEILWNIIDGKVRIPVKLNLAQERIPASAREIRDSNFYSVLEAALSD